MFREFDALRCSSKFPWSTCYFCPCKYTSYWGLLGWLYNENFSHKFEGQDYDAWYPLIHVYQIMYAGIIILRSFNTFYLFFIFSQVGHDSNGLPIGLQLIGRPWQEATLLRVSLALEVFHVFSCYIHWLLAILSDVCMPAVALHAQTPIFCWKFF